MNRIILPQRTRYAQKDQRKSDQATKFIGRGSPRSSTAAYALAWGDRANCGEYDGDDVVFVSAEGARHDRLRPDFAELKLAYDAGVVFITDNESDRRRPYNVGEREVADFLTAIGAKEIAPGTWA